MAGAGAVPRSPKHMPTKASVDSDSSSDNDSDEDAAAAWSAMNLPDIDDATRQLILDSIKANAASDEEDDEDDIRQALSDQPTTIAMPEEPHTFVDVEGTAAAAGATAAEDAIVQQKADLQAGASTLVETQQAPAKPALVRAPFKKLDSDVLEDYDQWDQDYWQSNMPEAVDTTVAAAQIWSRIIRAPRKRGKHILIDICSPREHVTNPDAVDTSHGHLVRQVVATTDKKLWLGPGGYRLARKSRWGDLWPKYYQDYALTLDLTHTQRPTGEESM